MWKKLLLEADEDEERDFCKSKIGCHSSIASVSSSRVPGRDSPGRVVVESTRLWSSNSSLLNQVKADPISLNSHFSKELKDRPNKSRFEDLSDEDDDEFSKKIKRKAFEPSSKEATPTKAASKSQIFGKFQSRRKLIDEFDVESDDDYSFVQPRKANSAEKVTDLKGRTEYKASLSEENDNDTNDEVNLILPVHIDSENEDEYSSKPAFGNASYRQADKPIALPNASSHPSAVYSEREINRFIGRYLLDHQIEGIQWMWKNFLKKSGVILGDDMGMGKSVQIVGLLSVLFQKTGTKEDKKWIRMKQIQENSSRIQQGEQNKTEDKLKYFRMDSPLAVSETFHSFRHQSVNNRQIPVSNQEAAPTPEQAISFTLKEKEYLNTPPVLIVCPKSLVDNWKNEIHRWGYFSLTVLTSNLREDDMILISEHAQAKKIEILLISYSQIDKLVHHISTISYSMMILDEGHILKNEKTKLYQQIMKIKSCQCRILLTGTPIQNDLKELWCLLNMISAGRSLEKSVFTKEIEKPIKLGMSATATDATLKRATKAREELLKILDRCLLTRKKTLLQQKKERKKKVDGSREDESERDLGEKKSLQPPTPLTRKKTENNQVAQEKFGDENEEEALLKGKDEVIVLCDLSPLQQLMYKSCLASPDFDNVRYHAKRCPCGSKAQRSQCCVQYQIPYRRDQFEEKIKYVTQRQAFEIDERAVLWRQFHENCQPCSTGGRGRTGCPLCVLLPSLNKLNKISCHPMLLQADPKTMDKDKASQAEEFLTKVFPDEVIQQLGGTQRSYRLLEMRQSTELSGKMKTLREMLSYFIQHQEKTLVFSLSTQVLDLIEILVLAQGWKCLRLDGQTPVKKRQQLVDQFNQQENNSLISTKSIASASPSKSVGGMNSGNSDSLYIFLISSRAGGLGLNLNTASKVIIFDVDWNPVVDMQSQDRAYRIGQKEHVTVYRLVSKGTVEELAYMRQLYKQQLQKSVLMEDTHVSPLHGADANIKRSKTNPGTPLKGNKNFRRGKFQGVEGESTMRGELFGIENLFQFSENSILLDLRTKYATEAASNKNVKGAGKKKGRRNNSAVEELLKDEIAMNENEETRQLEDSLKDYEKKQEDKPEKEIIFPRSATLQSNNFLRKKDMNSLLDQLLKEDEESGSLEELINTTNLNLQKDKDESEEKEENCESNELVHSETIAMSILKNIGVNLENAHRIDEILNDADETPQNSQTLISPSLSLTKATSSDMEIDYFFEMKADSIPSKPPIPSKSTTLKRNDTTIKNPIISRKTTSTKIDVSKQSLAFVKPPKPPKPTKSNIIEIDDEIEDFTPPEAETTKGKRKIPFLTETIQESKKRTKNSVISLIDTEEKLTKRTTGNGLYKPSYC